MGQFSMTISTVAGSVLGDNQQSEALSAPEAQLDKAFDAVLKAPSKGASQCAALRRILPWHVVESRLKRKKYTLSEKLQVKVSTLF